MKFAFSFKAAFIQSKFLFLQTISQSKLKSFSVGMMNAGLKKPAKSKQDVEEKKKVGEEDHECLFLNHCGV